jgi:DNA polymerase-3 subunit chi
VKNRKVYFIDLPVNNKPRYVCDITEKFYNLDLTVTIYCKSEQSTQLLNKLLWTWKQESFVPHTICPATNEAQETLPEPVLITTSIPLKHQTDALILFDPLDDTSVFSSFTVIIDFAETYNTLKVEESRNRFRELRDNEKYDLEFIKLGLFINKKEL